MEKLTCFQNLFRINICDPGLHSKSGECRPPCVQSATRPTNWTSHLRINWKGEKVWGEAAFSSAVSIAIKSHIVYYLSPRKRKKNSQKYIHLLRRSELFFRAVKDTFVLRLCCSITGHVSLNHLWMWFEQLDWTFSLCLSVSPLYPWTVPRPLWCFGGIHTDLC